MSVVFNCIIKKRFSSLQQSKRHLTLSKLIYEEYGDPVKVIKKCKDEMSKVGPTDVQVKMLAAPINPADINTIQGKYPSRPDKLPAVPGNEGVGEVVEVGCDVKGFELGDRVVPATNMLGTWRSHMMVNSTQILKVPKELGLIEASTLTVNPCTAYRMLKDFVDLKEGDVVIQNGGNSAVGQNVIQLARIWGLRSVNIVRSRPNVDELKTFLKALGATEVLTEEELRTTDIFKSNKLPKPKLGLNCVGGKSALELLRHLGHSAPMVTYGGMSREPVNVPTSALIFKDTRVLGFWMTAWHKRNADSDERTIMFNDLVSYMITKELQGPPTKLVQINNFREAIENATLMKGMTGVKYILAFNTL